MVTKVTTTFNQEMNQQIITREKTKMTYMEIKLIRKFIVM